MGVGLGLLTGSVMRWLAPQVRRQPLQLPGWLAQDAAAPERSSKVSASPTTPQLNAISGSFQPKTEIKALSARWRDIAATQKDLLVSAYLLMLDDGQYAQLNANRPMPAASSIKTPILMAALERIDTGERAWNEPLELTAELVAGEAGWMASRPVCRCQCARAPPSGSAF